MSRALNKAGGSSRASEGGELRLNGRVTVEGWFESRGWEPWPFQIEAWDAYAAGRSGLIQVATGAGKTFAAYLGPLAELIDEWRSAGSPRRGVEGLRVLYVTPLRAVSRDIELALREPIDELKLPFTVESRTGDTKASVRARQRERLPNVLITTPESLMLLLTRENCAELLGDVRCVVVDEWHELLSSKRGTQTELALSRLRGLVSHTEAHGEAGAGLRVWALSATLPNLEEAARCVAGATCGEGPVIVRARMDRPVIVDSILPSEPGRLPWAGHLGLSMLDDVLAALDPVVSTLVFTNTRSQAERWFHAIAWHRPEWKTGSSGVLALHHGSIDRAERERVERGLKNGSVRIVVATSSLDLGVDFTPVERVFQIGSPKGVARLVQRAGRSSHRPRTPCRVTCVPTHALELVEIAAARSAIEREAMEPRWAMSKPLDVLAQHLVSCALGGGFRSGELFEEVRTAWSFRDLTRREFDWAMALVQHGGEGGEEGKGGALSAYPEYHRIAEVDGVHRVQNTRIAQLHRLNVGTITGDSSIEIRLVSGKRLGRIDEGFVAGLREGERFVFAGRVLSLVTFKDLVAVVRPARGTTRYTPVWSGTKLPISESLSEAIRTTLGECAEGRQDCPELKAAERVVAVQKMLSAVPRRGEVLAELCTTREGHHLFMFPFEGRLVHAGLASLVALRLARLRKATFSISVNDYGFELLSAEPFPYEELLTPALFTRDGLVDDALESVNTNQLARLQFREIARIAGLVMHNHPGVAKTSRQLQASSGLIFDVLSEFDPKNLLLAQARREVLERHFEQSRLARTLARLASEPLVMLETARPTPLSFPLLMERQAAKHTSETIADRVRRMREQWDRDVSRFVSGAGVARTRGAGAGSTGRPKVNSSS